MMFCNYSVNQFVLQCYFQQQRRSGLEDQKVFHAQRIHAYSIGGWSMSSIRSNRNWPSCD